jgi:hypothetical protein
MFANHAVTKRLQSLVSKSTSNFLRFALLGSLAASGAAFAQSGAEMNHADHAGQGRTSPELVLAVRQATQQFVDPAAAMNAGYQPVLGCVSGPDHGAMGVHYLNGALLTGDLDPSKPQALIYEPLGGGHMRLVGVEFIVDSATWFKTQKEEGVQNPGPPALYGQLFQLVPSPNRYNLDTFFELHVWAWQDNPNGTFVDWNTKVNCDRQAKTL